MSRSPLTHYSPRRSPSLPIPHSVTSVENAGSSHFPRHRTSRDTHHGLEPGRRQWPPSNRKFWVYESPSPGSSQDGKSSNSSGGKSAGSETMEERCVRTVSPYGSFFAEEMESDTRVENRSNNNRSFRQREHDNKTSGVFIPNRKGPSRNWTSTAQAQMAPAFFTTGYSTFTNTSAVPMPALPGPDHHMTEMPFSALSLAENSRRSQPPLSWRQGHPDHYNHPQWSCNSQYDPPQVATAVPRDERQTDARDGSRQCARREPKVWR